MWWWSGWETARPELYSIIKGEESFRDGCRTNCSVSPQPACYSRRRVPFLFLSLLNKSGEIGPPGPISFTASLLSVSRTFNLSNVLLLQRTFHINTPVREGVLKNPKQKQNVSTYQVCMCTFFCFHCPTSWHKATKFALERIRLLSNLLFAFCKTSIYISKLSQRT